MARAARLVLDPQTETELIEAIMALDWNTDIVTKPLQLIQERLGLEEPQSIALFLSFQKRDLMICKPEHMANNLAETGIRSLPMRGKWVKPDETMQ